MTEVTRWSGVPERRVRVPTYAQRGKPINYSRLMDNPGVAAKL
ncbi:MAG: hypothetical protein ABSB68_11905 [Acidimicrobiales bacterium]|jgi:hypothetical protein